VQGANKKSWVASVVCCTQWHHLENSVAMARRHLEIEIPSRNQWHNMRIDAKKEAVSDVESDKNEMK